MKTIGRLIVFLAFGIGLTAFVLAAFYSLAMFLFVFQDESVAGTVPPAMAYMPKWIFLLVPLVLLGGTKPVQKFLGN